MTRCAGLRCDLTARAGHYRVRVAHGGSVDEISFRLHESVTVRGVTDNYSNVGYGVLLVVGGGLLTGGGLLLAGLANACVSTCGRTSSDVENQQVAFYAVAALGAVAGAGGIVLFATTHGSSIGIDSSVAPVASLRLHVALTVGGGALALSGTF